MRMRRSFNKEFKENVLQELATGKPVAQVCKEFELLPTVVCRWRREQNQNHGLAFAGKGNPAKTETKIAQLEQKIGQLCMENDFLKRVNKAMHNGIVEIKKNQRREP